jgi:SAM-dependent methyltransferase
MVCSSHILDRKTALQRWWQEALGAALLGAESELLAEALEEVFGWELLQVGAWGHARELLSGSRTRHQTIIAATKFERGPDVMGRASQLPIVSDSIDAVLLPHTLEFAADPYSIVREVDRVLVAEGHLIVMGFRPWSLWGLRAHASRNGFPPGMRRLLFEGRVQDWLELLGYEVVARRRYLYVSPWSHPSENKAGGKILRRGLVNPLPAGAYLLKARKRVYTLTPVRPRFREKTPVIGALVKPTTRSAP